MFIHRPEPLHEVRVQTPDPVFAEKLLEQFGGATGELTASLTYFTQSFHTEARRGDRTGRQQPAGCAPVTAQLLRQTSPCARAGRQRLAERALSFVTSFRNVWPTCTRLALIAEREEFAQPRAAVALKRDISSLHSPAVGDIKRRRFNEPSPTI
jgi:hypothetical protein